MRSRGERAMRGAMRLSLLAILALGASALLAQPACSGSSGTSGNDGGSSSSGGSSGGGSSGGGSSGASSSGASSSSGSGGSSSSGGGGSSSGGSGNAIKTVFLILMENNNWSDIYQNTNSAPYINGLLAQASWCTSYFDNPAAQHPSEPNYIWLEAGTNKLPDHTFTTDSDPSASNSSSADHLAKQIATKGVTWREYAEDISGNDCPISSTGNYAPKHVPFVFFTDVSGNPPSAGNAGCTANVRPYGELAGDLANDKQAQYNFITPNLCDDMHTDCGTGDPIKQGDDWLKVQIPIIMGSSAYKNGGAIFITWDESEGGENPIGMIVLSPLAKGNDYQGTKMYYHSSMVRSVQEIFGLSPLLNDAANQTDLADLFTKFP